MRDDRGNLLLAYKQFSNAGGNLWNRAARLGNRFVPACMVDVKMGVDNPPNRLVGDLFDDRNHRVGRAADPSVNQ